jgi:hypothetical protein
MSDRAPIPEPSRHLVPPGRVPPTAVATAMLPPPEPGPRRAPSTRGLGGLARRALTLALDLSDELAGRIRRGLLHRP